MAFMETATRDFDSSVMCVLQQSSEDHLSEIAAGLVEFARQMLTEEKS